MSGEAPEGQAIEAPEVLAIEGEAPEVLAIEGEPPAAGGEGIFEEHAALEPPEGGSSSSAGQAALGAPEGGSSSSAGPEVAVLPPSKGEEVKARLAAEPTRLAAKTYIEVEDEFIAVASVEDLRPQDRAKYEKVRNEGLGICARCRWQYGCQDCDEAKAWGWACRQTLWHEASVAVRPKAKPKGRPKAGGKGGKGGGK